MPPHSDGPEYEPAREHSVLHKRPDAHLQPVETQPPLIPDGITVERFTTAHRVIFERHTDANGVETWFKVERS